MLVQRGGVALEDSQPCPVIGLTGDCRKKYLVWPLPSAGRVRTRALSTRREDWLRMRTSNGYQKAKPGKKKAAMAFRGSKVIPRPRC